MEYGHNSGPDYRSLASVETGLDKNKDKKKKSGEAVGTARTPEVARPPAADAAPETDRKPRSLYDSETWQPTSPDNTAERRLPKSLFESKTSDTATDKDAVKTAEAAETHDVPLSEQEQALAELEPAEQRDIADKIAEEGARSAAEEAQSAAVDSPEELAAAATQALHDRAQDILHGGEVGADAAYDQAEAAVAAELASATEAGADNADKPAEDTDDVESAEVSSDTLETNDDSAAPEGTSGGNMAASAAEQHRQAYEDEAQQAVTGAQPPHGPIPPGSTGGGAASAGGLPPSGGSGSHAAMFDAGAPGAGAASRAQRDPRLLSSTDAMYYERKAQERGLLTGLIVGYLFGRRRGRIKTEKKFRPVQKHLEKQVSALQERVAVKEQRIRSLAAEKALHEREAGHSHQLATRLQQPSRERSRPEYSNPITRTAEAAAVPLALTAAETAQARSPFRGAERLGYMAVERPFRPTQSVPGERAINSRETKTAEQLSHEELLDMADTITIDRVPLRRMYEAHNINERSLRRIIAEHLRGGNTKEMLARELLEKELRFEREPGSGRQGEAGGLSGAGALAAATTAAQMGGMTKEERAREAYLAAEAAKAEHRRKRADNLIGAVLAVLATTVFIVLLVR